MAVRLLRPSGADTWGWCGASEELQERYPEDTDSDKAREGTAAHYYVAQALLGQPPAVGSLAPNGWAIDAEMVESGNVYLAYCRAEMAAASPTALMRVETKVTMHGMIHPLCEGTPDFFLVDAARKRIAVPDYKYGHRPVDAFQRLQALCYVAGCMEALELTGEEVADWTVDIAIIQPRSYHPEGTVRVWSLSGAEAYLWVRWLADRAQAAASGTAPCNTGEWCNDCSAQVYCAASQRVGGAALDVSLQSFAGDMPNDALALQYALVERAQHKLKGTATALEEILKAKVKAGQIVPGYGIKPKEGNLSWNDPQQAMALGVALGLDFRKPPMTTTVITPTQAIKDHGIPPEVVNAYATRKTSHELTKIDESAVRKAFG
jgi:hypothetical protein